MNGWTELILGVAVAALLLAVMAAGGARLRSLLRLPCPPRLAVSVDLLLGSLLLALPALVAGLLGAFGPVSLGLVATAVALTGRWSGMLRRFRTLRWTALAALPLALAAGAPPFFYDAWVYHLGLPWQALQEGAVAAHPENVFAAFPPLAQLVYAFPLSVGVLRAPALIHLFFFVAGAHAVAVLARRLGADRRVAGLAAIAMLYLPTSHLVPGLPAAEGWALTGLATAAAVALTGRVDRSAAVLSGLLAGAALAARLQGLPWALLIAAAIWARAPRRFERPGLAVAGIVAGASPWWLKNLWLLGEPWAPVGWQREGLETLWRDAGSNVFQAGGWWPALPGIYAALAGIAWLLVPVLLCGLLAYLLRRRLPLLLAVGLSTCGALLWAGTGSLPRFLIPTLALGLAVAAALPRKAAIGAAILLIAITGHGARRTWNQLSALGGLDALAGSGELYAAPRLTQLVGNPYPAFRAADRLPADARVLLVCEPRGFLLPRPFVTGSQHDPSPLRRVLEGTANPGEAAAELRRQGFSHILVNTFEERRLGESYPVLPWKDQEGFDRAAAFIGVLGAPVVDEAPVKIWALDSGG